MDRSERFHKIEALLGGHRAVSFAELQAELEVSRATVRRDLEYLRSRFHIPIEWSRDAGGYQLAQAGDGTEQPSHLTRLWFSSPEIHALLTMQHLLGSLDTSGVLAAHIAPLQDRLTALLGNAGEGEAAQLRQRVRVIGLARRAVQPKHFQRVGTALLQRKRLRIVYRARGSGNTTEREVSPLRLVHYRDNWHLDAWCHLRNALRSFSVDAVRRAQVLDTAAIDVPDADLDAVLGSGYGIFAGKDVQWATLRFSAERARWVAAETWHPKQRGHFEADGCYVLELPYADSRELVMDILRHVPEVEVVAPQGLKEMIAKKLRESVCRLTP